MHIKIYFIDPTVNTSHVVKFLNIFSRRELYSLYILETLNKGSPTVSICNPSAPDKNSFLLNVSKILLLLVWSTRRERFDIVLF
jgi:hypothetical protein